MALSDLNIRIGADIQQFTAAIQQVERQLKRVGREMQQAGTTMTQALTLPLAGLAAVSLKAYGDIDQLKKGLIAVSGSAEKAEEEFSRLREVAKLPGLGLNEAVRGSINLQSIGLSADEARTAMLAMGNAIATVGGGKANFDLAIRGFGQLSNAAKPMQQDLYQIANQLPQVNKLLIDAFGTNRAEDLAAMGISGRQLSEFLVDALSKLPPVTGGFNNAMENLGDTLKVSAGEFGEIINKAFNVEGIFNSISENIANLVKWFKTLSPETQRFALIAGAVLAAVGPLLAALGFLSSSVIPALISGFSLLTGPVGLVIATIAGAAYLIITNWEKIKEYFTTGGGARFLDGVMEVVRAAYDFFATVFGLIYDKIVSIWNGIGSDLFNIVKNILGFLVDMFAEGLSVVADIFDFLRAASTGDFDGMGDALLSIGKSIVNGLISIFQGLLRILGPIMAKVFELFGADQMANSIRNASSLVANYVEQFKFVKKEVDKATTSLSDFKKIAATATPQAPTNTNTSGVNQSPSVALPSIPVADTAVSDYSTSLVEGLNNTMAAIEPPLTSLQERMNTFAQNLSSTLSQGAQGVASGLGEIVGGMLSGTASISDIPKMILNTLGSLAQQVGKIAIGLGVAVDAIKKSLISFGGVGAIAAGVALIALGGAVKGQLSRAAGGPGGSSGGGGSIPKFANGGLAYGPTLAMVGDNRGASNDPEMIAPFSKVQSMFESIYGGGAGGGNVQFRISGTDLVGVLDKMGYVKRRTS